MTPTVRGLLIFGSLVVGSWSLVDAQQGPVLSPAPAIGEIAGNAAEQGKAAGYVEQEFFLEGTARSYVKQGEWTSDGLWAAGPGATAPYKIRVFARYPSQPSRFNGVVFVEWLNVSGGSEAAVNWTMLHDE